MRSEFTNNLPIHLIAHCPVRWTDLFFAFVRWNVRHSHHLSVNEPWTLSAKKLSAHCTLARPSSGWLLKGNGGHYGASKHKLGLIERRRSYRLWLYGTGTPFLHIHVKCSSRPTALHLHLWQQSYKTSVSWGFVLSKTSSRGITRGGLRWVTASMSYGQEFSVEFRCTWINFTPDLLFTVLHSSLINWSIGDC